jgi:ATP-dependent Clp protease protease subunit
MKRDNGRFTDRSLAESMFDRRMLFLFGDLDERRAGDLVMALMALDAEGEEPIMLRIDSSGGPLDVSLSVMDTIDLLSVPVHASSSGRVEGSAIGVLAVCERRRASMNARFRFCLPQDSFSGAATGAETWISQHRDRLDRFVARLSQASGQPSERLHADIATGRYLDAEEALRYGLIDEVLGRPDADVVPLKRNDP